VPRLQGRDFTLTGRNPPLAIVNATLARKLFSGADALGQRIRLARDTATPPWKSPAWPTTRRSATFASGTSRCCSGRWRRSCRGASCAHVRVTGSANVALVRDAYGRVVASLGHHFVRNMFTLEEHMNQSLLQERLVASLSLFLAALAVLLAGRRTREIGIRMALGSTNSAVVLKIIGEGFGLAALGRAGASHPAGVRPSRAITPLRHRADRSSDAREVGRGFVLVAGVAAAIPAYRAATIEPVARSGRSDSRLQNIESFRIEAPVGARSVSRWTLGALGSPSRDVPVLSHRASVLQQATSGASGCV
jgi:putative ABC transport system permease protein